MTDKQTNPLVAFRGALIERKDEFKSALPKYMETDKFIRTTVTAVQNNPSILNCERTSLLNSCMKAAQDGLVLDGREAALVEFKGKATYMPMVAGIMKLVRNSGQLSSLTAQVVREKDAFSYNPAMDEAPNHNPDWFGQRGDVIGVYAVAKLKDGSTVVEIMSRDDVEAIRKRSRSGNSGPWSTDWNEMARKTVIRRIAKYLPKSTDRDGERVFNAIEREDENYDFDDIEEVQETKPAKRTKRAADILNAETIDVDPDTGEVMDDAGPVTEPAETDVM